MHCLPILMIDNFSSTRRFVEFVHDYHGSLESPTGRAELAVVVQHTLPSLLDLSKTIQDMVALETGAVLIKGLGFERIAAIEGDAVRDALVLALTSTIGEPTDHCADKRVMWPVTSRKKIGAQTTFSETSGEAPLHTDSAFSPHPERYNALYVVRQSRCGGGQTVIVNGPRFLADFAKTLQGRDCIRFMREMEYPFRVPDAFFIGERFITAKILADEPLIRFRYDCLERGFDLCPKLATRDHRFYCGIFRDAIETHASRNTFLMADGDLIVYDNTRLLHGRTDFCDPLRHLIRVRMHD